MKQRELIIIGLAGGVGTGLVAKLTAMDYKVILKPLSDTKAHTLPIKPLQNSIIADPVYKKPFPKTAREFAEERKKKWYHHYYK